MNFEEFKHCHKEEPERALWLILESIQQLAQQIKTMSATLDQVLQDVSDESTLEDSIITLLNGIQSQLAAALSGATLPAATQAKVDAVFAALEANKTKVSAAIAANTPAAPAAGS